MRKKKNLIAAFCGATLLLASMQAMAAPKTLVFCSEGSPENFAPSINTTGTTFDASQQIYNNLVEFERGGTQVVPALAERWTVSPDGKEFTFASTPKADVPDLPPIETAGTD